MGISSVSRFRTCRPRPLYFVLNYLGYKAQGPPLCPCSYLIRALRYLSFSSGVKFC